MSIASTLEWLLEKENPGVRFLTLRDLVGKSPNDKELIEAKKQAYEKGPIERILKHLNPDGYWIKPGAGYGPKYKSAVWSLILLSQLGASANDDKRIKLACKYHVDHTFTKVNSISYNGTPSGVIDCMQGNICLALALLDYKDERLEKAHGWMARSVIGDNIKYYSYKCGPNFACGANGKKPCAWGATKVLLALSKIPEDKKTPVINKAIKAGLDFLLGVDPVKADYPTTNNTKPNRDWWDFGFPVFYITDILQIAEAVISAGFGKDKRLKNTIEFIKSKQDSQGRWNLEYSYTGKTWGNFGEKGEPNKWVTLRALKVLKYSAN
jgi:hypothetical protein